MNEKTPQKKKQHIFSGMIWNNKFHFCVSVALLQVIEWVFTWLSVAPAPSTAPLPLRGILSFCQRTEGCRRANCDVFTWPEPCRPSKLLSPKDPTGPSWKEISERSSDLPQLGSSPEQVTHRVQRVTSFRSAAMSFTQFITAMLLASVGMLLQGCGEESCDTDAINTCLTSYTESVVANLTDYPTICSAVNTYGSCLNSANCCPDSTAKNAIDAAFEQYNSFCTGDNAVTNPCAWTWSHGIFGRPFDLLRHPS